MNPHESPMGTDDVSQVRNSAATPASRWVPRGALSSTTEAPRRATPCPPARARGLSQVPRGLSDLVPARRLQQTIYELALRTADRFRVIRCIDLAVVCFPERAFKASLSAAQRAVRGLVAGGLLKRFRTDRQQVVYGLTQRGADWLNELSIDATASLRRVSDMTNPEHRLWCQFLVLAAQVRGLQAWTDWELMQALQAKGQQPASGPCPLKVRLPAAQGTSTKVLRPDALIAEADGATWIEVDRSARGSDRAADLRALVLAMGQPLGTGQALTRVVVFTRTDRIRRRVLAVLNALAAQTSRHALQHGRRQVLGGADDTYEVWASENQIRADKKVSLVDRLAGHVIVQALPTWLPKFRAGPATAPPRGWLNDNYLPYRRPTASGDWPSVRSPLLS